MCWYGCDPDTAPRQISTAEAERLAELTQQRRRADRARRAGTLPATAEPSGFGPDVIMRGLIISRADLEG